MSQSGEPAAHQYPAPGSQVPGAPPPLKRALTPADGIATAPAAPEHPRTAAPSTGAAPTAASWTAAAAMVGVAAGLELAGVLARIGAGRRRTKTPKC